MNACWGPRMARIPLIAVMVVALVPLTVTGTPPAASAAEQVPAPTDLAWTVPAVRAEPLDGGTIIVEGHGEHRGTVELVPHQGGLSVVAHLGLETYVRGIAEMSSHWPLEALKAQAIAARSYALSELGVRAANSWRAVADICASEGCQVYVGVAKERAGGGDRWVTAVEQTAGQVLLWNGHPIRAKYSSSNGGQSVPGGRPYLPSIDDPHDVHSPQHRWRSTLPLDAVGAALGLPAPPNHVSMGSGAIGLYVVDETTGQATAEKVLALPDFRAALNTTMPPPPGVPRPIPSVRFTAAIVGADLVLDGMGFGHGIGMSQWGAYGKAVQGWSAPQILSSYYGGITPTARPDSLSDQIRVALGIGEASATISGGAFRLVTPSGDVLAVAAGGSWTVRPASGGVRIAAGPGATVQPVDPAPTAVDAVDATDVAAAGSPSPLAVSPPATELAAVTAPEVPSQSWAQPVAALLLVIITVACAVVAATGLVPLPKSAMSGWRGLGRPSR